MNYFLLIGLLLLLSCNNSATSNSSKEKVEVLNKEVAYPVKVSLQDAMKNVDNSITLASFVDSIEYIPLKLPEEHMLKFFKLYGNDEQEELFFIGDIYQLLVINKRGELVNCIGKKGGGPGEYPQITDVSIDRINKHVYVYAGRLKKLFRYDYKGKFLKEMFRVDIGKFYTEIVYYNKDNFVTLSQMYHPGVDKIKDRLYGYGVMDTLGNLVHHTAPQCSQINTNEDRYIGLMFNYQMTQFKDTKLLVPSGLADTIFTAENNRIVPRYLLDYGDRKPKLEKIWESNNSIRMDNIFNSIFIMNPAYETDRFFLIKLRDKGTEYIVIHDKYLNKSYSTIYDYKTRDKKSSIPVSNLGFYNDLDGGLDAYPICMSTDGNYWVSYIEAYNMLEILNENHFSKHLNVRYPKQQENLKKILHKMKEDDDQVLILMKLRKDVLE